MEELQSHNVLHHLKRHLHHRTGQAAVLGTQTINEMASMVRRQESSSTCSSGNNSPVCAKSEDANNTSTVIIALCAAIPTTVALVVLWFLHRRIRRRQRAEDASDPHKSLDFGMDAVNASGRSKKGGKGVPEMTITDMETSLRPGMRGRGLSMDIGSPYLLPAAVHGSRDSLHSMSRSMPNDHDPYRPVTFIKSDTSSTRHTSRMRPDNMSTYTGSSERSGENARLLQRPTLASPMDDQFHFNTQTRSDAPPRKTSLASGRSDRWYPRDENVNPFDSSPDLSNVIPATPQDMLSDKTTMPSYPQTAQRPLAPTSVEADEQKSYTAENIISPAPMEDSLRIMVPPPTHNRQSPPRSPAAMQPNPAPHLLPVAPHAEQQQKQTHEDVDQHLDMRRVSVMGLRPLPPDDPTDNPEQRANRIRSFYREYFDDSKPNPPGHYPQYDSHAADDYHDILGDVAAVFDPETGAFYSPQQPFAEPVGRRAMTPPPRGAASPFMRGHRSAASTQSAGRPATAPKKRLPPPQPLKSLPTPHMLMNDSSILSTMDFAPRGTYRDAQLGRGPDSPLGSPRPYSPAFRAHSPLVKSFDDLAVMPSPHALRKSSTFTALDFAPPPRFKGVSESGSDAGSIRSNRSGISAVQRDAIRAGAYRVSRLPTDMVGTHTDLASSLKPQWDMRK